MSMPTPVEVLFVCLGNICRSPSAHAVFESMAVDGLRTFDSAGLGDWHRGELPDKRARAAGLRRGYELTHRARPVDSADFDRFPLIVAMEPGQVDELRARRAYVRQHHGLHLDDPDRDQIILLRAFDPEADGASTLADPYYEADDAFDEMFTIIERCVPELSRHISEMLSRSS